MNMCVCVCMYVCMYVHVYIYIYIYIYIYTYKITHTTLPSQLNLEHTLSRPSYTHIYLWIRENTDSRCELPR
jgi:hypothetical protein